MRLRTLFFFFQAEDGIRDKLVTGVQTCALPILSLRSRSPDMSPATSNYRFTKRPLTTIYGPDQKKRVARVFLGEWMKLLNDGSETKKYVEVQYRGGKGWVAAADIGPNRMLEVYFITGNQGDAIFIQTPDDRRILIDGGPDDEALHFIRN